MRGSFARVEGERRLYHLECPSGLAGDMFLGACLDLGMPLEVLATTVAELGLAGIGLESRRASRGGIGGVRFRVTSGGRPIEGPDPEEVAEGGTDDGSDDPAATPPPACPTPFARDFAGIRGLLARSALRAPIRERALELFTRLAEVEGRIHGVSIERVHFHEVGAIDSIVDLVGACAAVEYLRPQRLTCGTVVVGSGTTRTEHGVLPIPAPATAALLEGVPTIGGGEGELLTPTGALILRAFCDGFGAQPAMVAETQGYGLGRRDPRGRANVARLTRGRPLEHTNAEPFVWKLETQVDDASGESLGFVLEHVLEAGALDVYFTAVQMKKNRPGTLITVLARDGDQESLARLLMRESGSLGCRLERAARREAERSWSSVVTPFGDVRVKVGRLEGEVYVRAPEYEDCRRLAKESGVGWREVYDSARHAQARDAEAASNSVASDPGAPARTSKR